MTESSNMKIVRARYTIARLSCATFLDPNTQVLFSGSIMCVRACTNFTDPLPFISPHNRLIVKQRRHRNNPKLDRMLTSRELLSNVQTHDECNSNSYTSHYLLFCELRPNVVLASDEKPLSSLLPKRQSSAYMYVFRRV